MNKISKKERQTLLLQAVREQELATQQDVVRALKKLGVSATQVSVSRDINELGLVKASGRYQAALPQAQASDPDFPLRAWINSATPAGTNLIVLKCDPGSAQRVARALDELGPAAPDLVGTVAGDDTVFCAVSGASGQQKLLSYIKERL